jgi:23S rRNA pseudouridine2605 synthase
LARKRYKGRAFSISEYRFSQSKCASAFKRAQDCDVSSTRKEPPFMPRDKDNHNNSRGRSGHPPRRKARSGIPRGPEKKLAKRAFAGRDDAERSYAAKPRDGRAPPSRFQESRHADKRPRFADRPDRGDERPWQRRDRGDRGEGRAFDKPKFGKFREPRETRSDNKPSRFSRPGDDRRSGDRPHRGHEKFDPSRGRTQRRSEWQEHSRSEGRTFRRDAEPARRENEDERKIFAKRKAFGGRGAYRERKPDERRADRAPDVPRNFKKSSERIAKVMSRAGLASRRDAEAWIVQGRVTVNGRLINSPALDVTANDVITVDGKPLPPRERTRLFLYHKPRGLMTTHSDPEGRPTVFDNLPEGLPRLISVGRLDFNTEGLLLLTNDGGLARALELPETGWLRRYRVRAHGEVSQAQLDALKQGIEIDGIKYGPIEATLERDQGANVWLVFAIREGKNREVRNVMAHLGLEVNRLIRLSYGPFRLADLVEGALEEVKTRVLREQLGEKVAALSGADFDRPIHGPTAAPVHEDEVARPRGDNRSRPSGKSGLIADRKGRRVLVQRTGSADARARNEAEAAGYGPPRRPRRGYHGKRDLKPRDE